MRNSPKTVPHPCKRRRLLHAVFIRLNHTLYHLASDGAGLTAGELTVITVLQVDTDLLNVSDTS